MLLILILLNRKNSIFGLPLRPTLLWDHPRIVSSWNSKTLLLQLHEAAVPAGLLGTVCRWLKESPHPSSPLHQLQEGADLTATRSLRMDRPVQTDSSLRQRLTFCIYSTTYSNPSNLVLTFTCREIPTSRPPGAHAHTHTHFLRNIFTIVEAAQVSIDRWICKENVLHTHNGVLFSLWKMKEVLTYAITCKHLEDIMQTEIS